jgi:hypothetical protein
MVGPAGCILQHPLWAGGWNSGCRRFFFDARRGLARVALVLSILTAVAVFVLGM